MSKTKIIVLGSTGMLGSAVSRYFDTNAAYELAVSTRAKQSNITSKQFFFDALKLDFDLIPRSDYIINCIGCIKQKNYDDPTFTKVNAEFPIKLTEYCNSVGTRLIHITTDCVFSGLRGNYTELDTPDCNDVYGCTKSLGEPTDCLVLRTSVIGQEHNTNFSLLSWAMSQAGKQVEGYTNHLWNGITALQYAKVCDQIIQNDLYECQLRHIFSTTVSKHRMLEVFNRKYDLNLKILPREHEHPCDRTLATVYNLNERLCIPTFEQMMEQL